QQRRRSAHELRTQPDPNPCARARRLPPRQRHVPDNRAGTRRASQLPDRRYAAAELEGTIPAATRADRSVQSPVRLRLPRRLQPKRVRRLPTRQRRQDRRQRRGCRHHVVEWPGEIAMQRVFAYVAVGHDGSVDRATIDAADAVEARRAVASRGLLLLSMEEQGLRRERRDPLSPTDLALGLRILGDLLDSGLSVTRAL